MAGGVAATLGVLIALAVGACGGGGDDDGDDGSKASVASGDSVNPPFKARVEITANGYKPRHVRILVGGSVTFVNMDETELHTAETKDLPEGATDNNEFDTHSLTWEEPYTVIFHKPETVKYFDALDSDVKPGTVKAVPKL
jgi:plastocyanin